MADDPAIPELPPGILVQRVQIEFMQPDQWDKHCAVEAEGVNRHGTPWGHTFQPASKHAAIQLVAALISQARASF
jgi:hypothetical protein